MHNISSVRTAILIDDSRTARRMLRWALDDLGVTCLEFGDAEALEPELPLMRPPDLLLVDMHLPGMSGLDFIARVRALPAWDTTVIALCTSDRSRILASAAEALSARYMVKPMEGAHLAALLAALEPRPDDPARTPSSAR